MVCGCCPCLRRRRERSIFQHLEQGTGVAEPGPPAGEFEEPLLLQGCHSPPKEMVQTRPLLRSFSRDPPTPLATPLNTPLPSVATAPQRTTDVAPSASRRQHAAIASPPCDCPRSACSERTGNLLQSRGSVELQSCASFQSAMSEPSLKDTLSSKCTPPPKPSAGPAARRLLSLSRPRSLTLPMAVERPPSRAASRSGSSRSLVDHLQPAGGPPFAVHVRPPPPVPPLPPDLAAGIAPGMKCSPRLLNDWTFLSDPANVECLRNGGSLYKFVCCGGQALGEVERRMIDHFVNMTAFPEPTHPPVTAGSSEFIFILNKAQYLFGPGVRADHFTTALLSRVDYHKNCQPGGPKVWTDVTEPDTFRFTKTIIPFVYKVTIQFRVSVLPVCVLQQLGDVLCEGLPICRGLLLERTKRDKQHVDSTRTVKSLLLYHALPAGGLLVTSVTCVANTSMPSIAAKVVDTFGGSGANEVAETAERTRKYLQRQLCIG